MKNIDLTTFKAENSQIIVARRDVLAVKFSTKENSRVICPITPDMSEDAKYLTFDIYVHNDETCCCLEFEFFDKNNSTPNDDFFFIIGLLPKVSTTVSIPLDALSGNRIFLDRNKGALKFLIHGKNLDIADVSRFAIRARKSAFEQRIQISDMRFTAEAEDKLVDSAPMVDKFGQWKGRQWPQKIHSEQELIDSLKAELEGEKCSDFGTDRSKYGGWTGKRFEATGFFRTEKADGRWWMVDPEGCAFFSAGLDCVNADESYTNLEPVRNLFDEIPDSEGEFADAYKADGRFDFAIANLIRAFGQDWYKCWTEITRNRLFRLGFNTIANWSDMKFARSSNIPYVICMGRFPKTEKLIFRDFPDVFSEEYQVNCDKFAEQLEKYVGDPYVLGYFLSNEPNWAWGEKINIAEDMLRNPEALASKDKLCEFIKERYNGDINAVNSAWQTKYADFTDIARPIAPKEKLSEGMYNDLMDFSNIMIRRYCELPSLACRKVDPDHLNLGLRYASIPNPDILAGCNAFDVFSMNCYKIDPSVELERAAAVLDMPMMIGEYHFGAIDAGLPASGLRAVTTQAERAGAYKYYLHCAANMPNCVGVHYFTLNDQPALGRFDGENYQIGFVNVCGREYKEICQGAIEAHESMYRVMAGEEKRYNLYPEETDWIAY